MYMYDTGHQNRNRMTNGLKTLKQLKDLVTTILGLLNDSSKHF